MMAEVADQESGIFWKGCQGLGKGCQGAAEVKGTARQWKGGRTEALNLEGNRRRPVVE